MNLLRKKPPQPLNLLQTIFTDATNSSIQYYDYEKNNQIKRAYQGWKALHTSLLYQLDNIHKVHDTETMSNEEKSLYFEIKYLNDKAKENMNRLEVLLMKELSELNSNGASTPTATNTNSNSSSQSLNDQQQRRMLKTLRSPDSSSSLKFHSSRFGISNASVSQLSKTAANKIWNDEKSHNTKKLEKSDDSTNVVVSPDLFKDFSNISDPVELLDSKKPKSHSKSIKSHQQDSNFTTLTISSSPKKQKSPSVSLKSTKASTKANNSTKTSASTKSNIALKASKISTGALKPSSISSTKSDAKSSRPTKAAPKPPKSRTVAVSSSSKGSRKVKHELPKSAPTSRTSSPKLHSSSSARGTVTADSHGRKPKQSQQQEQQELDVDNEDEILSQKSDADKEENAEFEQPQFSEAEIQEAMQNKIISEIKGIDETAAKQIFNEIVDQGDEVHWSDIAGLEAAKNSLKEAVVYPFLRPDLFSGLREPARGMLLFGPPGTGKTMLAKAVATESKSTFFSISASSLTSKYLGESEKLVRALFQLAKKLSPSIIFIDEIDSLLSARTDNENESTRRIKTEFLIQWNDLSHAAVKHHKVEQPRVLVLAATNLPWNIDEAARRRFVRRQYIPLPEATTRRAQFEKMLSSQNNALSEEDLTKLIEMTDGFSGSDITALTKDAAMNPLRELGEKLLFTPKEEIRGLELRDFVTSMNYIRPSVSKEGLNRFDEWAAKFGSSGA